MVTAIIVWKHIRKEYLRWFLPYLFFIVLVELAGWYFQVMKKVDISWLFNVSVPVEYLFYTCIFLASVRLKWIRRLMIAFIILFTGYVLWYTIFRNVMKFNNIYLLTGSFTMIIWCILFFYDSYQETEVKPLFTAPMFWITIGVFLFNAGEFSYDLLSIFIAKNNLDPNVILFWKINRKLNILLYVLISTGLLCRIITLRFRKDYRTM